MCLRTIISYWVDARIDAPFELLSDACEKAMPTEFSSAQLRHSQELSTEDLLSGNYLVRLIIDTSLEMTQN